MKYKLLCSSILISVYGNAAATEDNDNFLRKLAQGDNYSVNRVLPESICGVDDLQHVERYNGTYSSWGYTHNYVNNNQRSVGALKASATNASRSFCTGTLISADLFLTASHCIDNNITSDVVAFNYQFSGSSNTVRSQEFFNITEVVEDGRDLSGSLDYAILRLSGSPGNTYGWKSVQTATPNNVMIIQHPRGEVKQLDAGNDVVVSGTRIRYGQLDTEPGSSGSGVLNAAGEIVGVHTNGGCHSSGGRNSGYTITAINNDSSILPISDNIRAINNFGTNAGGWQVSKHPRVMADINGDGLADIIGFGTTSVFTALANSNGTFSPLKRAIDAYTVEKGGWDVARHPRTVADINGDGLADIVGFGTNSVFTSLSNGNGTFAAPKVAINSFTTGKGGWDVAQHPRKLADINGDGLADIVGFGTNSVFTALANGDGTFAAPKTALNAFTVKAGSWQVNKHPRQVADINGDGLADIVGFGNNGVFTSLAKGDGTFTSPKFVLSAYAINAGGWQVDKHPRVLADINGDGLSDIIGFGTASVFKSLSNGDGTFSAPSVIVNDFTLDDGWKVDQHPRAVADVTGNGKADIIGFSSSGVLVKPTN